MHDTSELIAFSIVSGFTQKDNLLSTKSGAQSTGKQVQVEFWKENY